MTVIARNNKRLTKFCQDSHEKSNQSQPSLECQIEELATLLTEKCFSEAKELLETEGAISELKSGSDFLASKREESIQQLAETIVSSVSRTKELCFQYLGFETYDVLHISSDAEQVKSTIHNFRLVEPAKQIYFMLVKRRSLCLLRVSEICIY